MKKISAILLALIMMLSMVASAASITIKPADVNGGTETGITYTAYKIFDATISGTNVSYTIETTNPYYSTIDAAKDYFTLTKAAGSETTYVVTVKEAYTEDVANTFAETLKAVSATAAGTLTKQEDGTYKLADLANGYYLVTSSVGSDLILDTIGDIEVDTKNAYPTIDKWVEQKGTVNTTADHDEVLNYGIEVYIPEDATGEIVVHDKMTNLSYVAMTAVEGITAATTCNDCTVTFTLSADYVSKNLNKTITINYTAKFEGEDIAENDAWLVDGSYTTKIVETSVYTTDVVINKVISGTTNPLADAEFVLKNAAGKFYKVANGTVSWVDAQADATVVKTDAAGAGEFSNIADGDYQLVEIKAPVGYNLLTKPVDVKVTAVVGEKTEGEGEEAKTVKYIIDILAKVENSSGSELPSTGGIGTTIFYTVGGLMMAAAIVLLVAKKKVAASK